MESHGAFPSAASISAPANRKASSRRKAPIMRPMIVVVCFIGAYTVSASKPDLLLVVLFGIMGYAFKKLDYPIAPLVLAMVLGDKAEDAFRQSMIMSKGSLSIFWSNPLVSTLSGLGLFLLCWPMIASGLRRLVPIRQPADAFED